MFFRIKRVKEYRYLQLVENHRAGSRTVQRVVASLGRIDELQGTGGVQALIRSLARFAGDPAQGTLAGIRFESAVTHVIGPHLVAQQLWQAAKLPEVFAGLASETGAEFPLEESLYRATRDRLFGPLPPAGPFQPLEADTGAAEAGEQHQLVRALLWLGRYQKAVEDRLFQTQEGDEPWRGHFVDAFNVEVPDNRPEAGVARPAQTRCVPVAVLRTAGGRPLASRLWPAGRDDGRTLSSPREEFGLRFGPRDACWVSPWHLVSDDDLAKEEEERLRYIVGGPLRQRPEWQAQALPHVGRLAQVADHVLGTELVVEGRRHIVYRDTDASARDAADRDALLEEVREELDPGDPTFPPDDLDDRFLDVGPRGFEIDRAKVEADARWDGVFLVRTNTTLPLSEVMAQFKRSGRTEEMVAVPSQVRPFCRRSKTYLRGEVFCNVLALLLVHELQRRLALRGHALRWAQIRDGLRSFVEFELQGAGRRYRLRPSPGGGAGAAVDALGIEVGLLVEEVPPSEARPT